VLTGMPLVPIPEAVWPEVPAGPQAAPQTDPPSGLP
jgi:hypothetical protein